MNRLTITAGLFLGALFIYVLAGDSAEEEILHSLEELRIIAEVTEKQHPLQQAAVAKKIAQFFAEQTSFDFTSAGYRTTTLDSRSELSRRVLSTRAHMTSLELALEEPDIVVSENAATVEITGSVLGSTVTQEGQFLEIHRIRVFMEKIDGEWLISGAEHIRNERGAEIAPGL